MVENHDIILPTEIIEVMFETIRIFRLTIKQSPYASWIAYLERMQVQTSRLLHCEKVAGLSLYSPDYYYY
jgi:hypothetical protein